MSSETQLPLSFYSPVFRMWVQNGCQASQNLYPCSSKEGGRDGHSSCLGFPLKTFPWSFIHLFTSPRLGPGHWVSICCKWIWEPGDTATLNKIRVWSEEGGSALTPHLPLSFQCPPLPQSLSLSLYLTNIHWAFPRPGPGSPERNKKSFLLLKRSWSNL